MTNELRAKFEEWLIDAEITHENVSALWAGDGYADGYIGALWEGFEAAHASREAEVEALQDALFQISVRLKVEREPDMDDMSWHTDMIARAQYLANLEDAAMREGK